MKKRFTAFFVALLMTVSLLTAFPIKVQAAYDQALIDLDLLGTIDLDNTTVLTESQWLYHASSKALILMSPTGVYRLSGSCPDLALNVNSTNQQIILSNAHWGNNSQTSLSVGGNCTIILEGSNGISGGAGGVGLIRIGSGASLVFSGYGTLSLDPGSFITALINFGSLCAVTESANLIFTLCDNSSLTVNMTDTIYIDDNASVTVINNNTSWTADFKAEAYNPASSLKWKLADVLLLSGKLTDPLISVRIEAGKTGTIAREPLSFDPAAPKIYGPGSKTLPVWYTATKTAAFTIRGTPTPTVTKVSGNSLITWNDTTKKLEIAAGLPVGDYPVILLAVNGINPQATFTFNLTVVADLTATIDEYTEVVITYDAETGADYYQIQRSNVKNKGFKTIATTTDEFFIDSYLKADTTYYYRVRSAKQIGSKISYGKFSTAIPKTTAKLPPPIGGTVFADIGALNFTWSNPGGMAAIQIYYATTNTKKTKWAIMTFSNPNFALRKLPSGKRYYFKTRHVYFNGSTSYSDFSPVASLVTQ